MSNDVVDRRSVLKALGTSSLAAAALSSGASAESGETRVARYERREQRVAALEEHAGEVLAELAERGILERPTLAEFDLETRTAETRVPAATSLDAWNAVEYTDPETGRRTDHLILSKTTGDHDLTVHVRPRLSEAYAIVAPRGSDGEFAVDPSGAATTEGVDTEACEGSCDCGPETCSIFPVLYEATYIDCIERDGGCQCYVSGTECGCDPLVGC